MIRNLSLTQTPHGRPAEQVEPFVSGRAAWKVSVFEPKTGRRKFAKKKKRNQGSARR